MMRLIIRFFFAAVLSTVGFGPFIGIGTSQEALKIQITHSHDHGRGHHHRDNADLPHAGHQKSEFPDSQSTGDSNHSDQHSHELVIFSTPTVFIEAKSVLPAAFEIVNIYPDSKDVMPPSDRSLESIFRPPIFA